MITEHRQAKPLGELLRKKKKAFRRGLFTQEDIDYAVAFGREVSRLLNGENKDPEVVCKLTANL